MKKFLRLTTLAMFAVGSAALCVSANAGKVGSDCTYKGKKLYGKIQVVNSFPDLKVQRVTSFPDLKVQWVNSFPNKCGTWQKTSSFPDLKIQYVDSFPDIKIQEVNSFPGLP